jgi:thiamine-phosphate pyrophosphorylase
MPEAETSRCRLCLVTPLQSEPAALAKLVGAALSGGDVASLIIAVDPADPGVLQFLAEAIVPIAAARGVATLIHNDTRIVGRTGADGVHVDSGAADLTGAVSGLRPKKKIVGAGGIRSRHEAMGAGEADPDYVFFGRLDGDTGEAIFAKALELAAWWSSLFVIPAIVMGGSAIASVRQAAEARIEFVALSRAVFAAADPATAVAEANRILAGAPEPVP